MKNLGESRPDFTKNWLNEKKALRDTRIRNVHELEELKRAQELRIDELCRHELRESHATIQELTSQLQELQERMKCMNDSREFQDVDSICSGKLSHFPSQPAIVPSLGGMLSCDPSLRLDTWNLLGSSANVFDSPCAVIHSSSTPHQGMLHSLNQSANGEVPVRESTGKPFAGCEERNQETIPTQRFVRRPSTTDPYFPAEGGYPHDYMTDQSRLQISELQRFHVRR